MSKLSVIMPVYQVEAFLRRGIDSVLNQTVTDWELILVDDGSTDGGAAICDAYAALDTRITVAHKTNAGAGSARNMGLALASGEFVAFPDSDDWVEADAYRDCICRMENDSLDLLLFGSLNTVYAEDGSVAKETKGKIADLHFSTQKECREHWADLLTGFPMDGPSNKMYRMSVIRENNVAFPDLRRMQDGVFNMRYYRHIRSFAAIEKYYYHFTMHAASYQRKKIPASFLECAATYHQTAVETATAWGMLTPATERKLGEWFSETVLAAQLEYFPQGGSGFWSKYRHIRSINRNPYVSAFYRRYRKLAKLSKQEKAAANKWNFLLAVFATLKKR